MTQRARFPVEVARPVVRCGRWFRTPSTLWRGSLVFALTWRSSVRYDYLCQRGKPMKTDVTCGVKSGPSIGLPILAVEVGVGEEPQGSIF